MVRMQDYFEFTFAAADGLDQTEDQWNLNDKDGAEGVTAETPLTIEHLSKNMDEVLVSRRNIHNKDNEIWFCWIEKWDHNDKFTNKLSWRPMIPKYNSTSKTVSSTKKTLKEEISELLKAHSSLHKSSNTIYDSHEDLRSQYASKYKLIKESQSNWLN